MQFPFQWPHFLQQPQATASFISSTYSLFRTRMSLDYRQLRFVWQALCIYEPEKTFTSASNSSRVEEEKSGSRQAHTGSSQGTSDLRADEELAHRWARKVLFLWKYLPPSPAPHGHKIGEMSREVPQHSVLEPFFFPTYPSVVHLQMLPMTNYFYSSHVSTHIFSTSLACGCLWGIWICLESAYGAFSNHYFSLWSPRPPTSAAFSSAAAEMALWYCYSDLNILFSA